MSESRQVAYEFGTFRLLPADRQLVRSGKPVALTPKVFDTLVLLVESGGRLVEKDEFLARIWPDTVVEEVGLAHNISQLRRALRNGMLARPSRARWVRVESRATRLANPARE